MRLASRWPIFGAIGMMSVCLLAVALESTISPSGRAQTLLKYIG